MGYRVPYLLDHMLGLLGGSWPLLLPPPGWGGWSPPPPGLSAAGSAQPDTEHWLCYLLGIKNFYSLCSNFPFLNIHTVVNLQTHLHHAKIISNAGTFIT